MRAGLLCVLLVVCGAAAQALAQDQGGGTIRGNVFDSASGAALEGVTVTLIWPAPGGSNPRQDVRTTNADGAYEFASIPPGRYTLNFVLSGFRASSMTGFEVLADQINRADFPLPRPLAATSDPMPGFEEFVVEASVVEDLMSSRLEDDKLLNIMTAEDFSKFAAGDVASALKRMAGVNVVEGQFAIIRGLEDRYSSTLYNRAPIPSPDPDRQSVQLDLFPSDVVGNLVVAKTFAADLPSNSAGGSIDIVTHQYPEEFETSFYGGTGFNDRADDRFIDFDDGSPIGKSGDVPLENDWGFSLGGRSTLFEREVRFKGVWASELDFETREGWAEEREPTLAVFRNFPRPARVIQSGGGATGDLDLSGGRYDLTESERADQSTGYVGFGFDVDTAANHQIDGSFFFTSKNEEIVQQKENGYLPGLDISRLVEKEQTGQEITASDFGGATNTSALTDVRELFGDPQSRGPVWFSSFRNSNSFDRNRDLLVYQVNGRHRISGLDGLELSWAANHATTTQDDGALGTRYWFEPNDANIPTGLPVPVEAQGEGRYFANGGFRNSQNEIEENQNFARFDTEYEAPVFAESVVVKLDGGVWLERANRDVASSFLETSTVGGVGQFALNSGTENGLGNNIFGSLDTNSGDISGTRNTTNESEREINAYSLDAKVTLFEQLDLLGGLRLESIYIESNNNPFTGEASLTGAPAIFPVAQLFFDRADNPSLNEVTARPPAGTTFNDQILNLNVQPDADGFVDLRTREQIQAAVNGEIDDDYILPSLGITYRPIERMALRGVYSRTVARPSFREIGYYVSTEPGTNDLIVGNPQLQLSEVSSYDTRAEYTWGDLGDLAAVSGFFKTIDDPIESIVVRNPLDFEGSSAALFRTFFNNPNRATVRGLELEARKNLGFMSFDLPSLAFLEYFSIGGNYTLIDAEVDRSEIEIGRASQFFVGAQGDPAVSHVSLEKTRRLFGQPEWIGNFDVSFDQPDWGTRITLAWFGISDVLDAAGTSTVGPTGQVVSMTFDRYVDAYDQLDLILSQEWRSWTFKLSVKNLTDSTRKIIYDPEQTRDEIAERSLQVGRDVSFSIKYAW